MFGYEHNPWKECSYCGGRQPCTCSVRPFSTLPPLALMNRPKETPTMNDPRIDVQATLDKWLADNPEAEPYVSKIYYLPDGVDMPRDVTHMNRLTSMDHPDLDLRLGVVATAKTAALANVILGLIERAAADPKRDQ